MLFQHQLQQHGMHSQNVYRVSVILLLYYTAERCVMWDAAKEEEGKRVKVFRITGSMNQDNTKIIMDKITQHIEMRTKGVNRLKQKFIEEQGRL